MTDRIISALPPAASVSLTDLIELEQAASSPHATLGQVKALVLAGMPTFGSAASADVTDFATADQGTLADNAVPQAAVGVSIAQLVGGVIPSNQMPPIAITEFLGVVASEPAMLALVGQRGDWAIRSDTGATWIISGADPSVIGGWTQLSYPGDAVVSVNTKVGVVVLNAADVGADASGSAATALIDAKAYTDSQLPAYTAESTANKVTTIDASSTDTEYPSAKAAYLSTLGKQDKLVSATNIKTVNGVDLLGAGDIVVVGVDAVLNAIATEVIPVNSFVCIVAGGIALADATTLKPAWGYVSMAAGIGDPVNVYCQGTLASSGLTPGATYYLRTGGTFGVAMLGVGEMRQDVGVAISATELAVFLGIPMTRQA